jgi:hypothetical protein
MSFSRAVRALTAAAMLLSVPGPSWASVVETSIEVPSISGNTSAAAVQATSLAPLAPAAYMGLPTAAPGLSAFSAPSAVAAPVAAAVSPVAAVAPVAAVPLASTKARPAAALAALPAASQPTARPAAAGAVAAVAAAPALAASGELAAPHDGKAPAPEKAAEASAALFDGSAATGALGDRSAVAVVAPAEGRREGFWSRLGLRAVMRAKDPVEPPHGQVPAAAPSGFSPEGLTVHLAGLGREPVSVPLSQLGAALAADPAYADALAKSGRVRWVVRRGDATETEQKAAAPGMTAFLDSFGVKRGFEVEAIAPPRVSAAAAADEAAAAPKRSVVSEAGFLARQFGSAMSSPSRSEVMGGLITRAPFIAINVLAFAPLYLPGHPIAFALLAGLTLTLKTFHSFWVDGWAAFQNRLARLRGIPYLAAFNLIYGQIVAAIYRTISWTALKGIVPPWALSYWRDMGIVTLIGTFVGTLAGQGINELYEKGVLSRKGRSAVIQVRSLAMDGSGYFFKTGLMHNFWPIFIVMQTLDMMLYAFSALKKPRAVLYIAADGLSASQEFTSLYPVTPRDPNRPTGLARARQSVAGLLAPLGLGAALLAGGSGTNTLAKSYHRALDGKSMRDAKLIARLPVLTLKLDANGHPMPATTEGGISVPLLVKDQDGSTGVFKPIRMDTEHPLYPYERMKLLREVVGGSIMRKFGVATLDYRLARAVLDGREVLGIVSPYIDVREPVAGSDEERRLIATEAFARGSVIDAWMGNTDRILNRGNLWVNGRGPASAMVFGDFDQGFRDGVQVLGVPKVPLLFHAAGVSREAAAKARAEILALSDADIKKLVDSALSRSGGFGAEAREYFTSVLIRNRNALKDPRALTADDGLRVRLSLEQASALADAALAAPEDGGDDLKDVVYLWDKPQLVAPTRELLTRLVADKRAGRPQAVELSAEQLALLPVLMNLVYVRLSPDRAIRSGIGYYP